MNVQIHETIQSLRADIRARRGAGTVGFVPTMGALHRGHARLIESARARCNLVVVSIFVNPLQFDVPSDYERYARTLPADLDFCESAGADLVFAPPVAEMYPQEMTTFVEVTGLTDHFCGASRPGHFRGVATVVSKLFGIVLPDLAFFGEKDAQQLAVIRRMVRDLNFPIRIEEVATVRDADGLALSSRNARLSPSERAQALCLSRALLFARDEISRGPVAVPEILEESRKAISEAGATIDYFDLADRETMRPVAEVLTPVRAMGAIWVGGTRLIDNMLCHPRSFSLSNPSIP